MSHDEKPQAIEVPWENLSPDALQGVIDDFILREGTDYGSEEVSHDKKRADIIKQLKAKKIRLWFDPETESITLAVVP